MRKKCNILYKFCYRKCFEEKIQDQKRFIKLYKYYCYCLKYLNLGMESAK